MTRLMDRDLEALREALSGRVIVADDADYDVARSVWNGGVDHRPAAIVRCTGPGDVAAAIRFGREYGFEISVRGGGHNIGGAAVADGGLVVDLSALRRVEVDPVSRRARCGGGATWADVDVATQAHGLAVPGGTISHTGIGGLTLGGGFGWLTREYGLTADNLDSADVVLADGQYVRASFDDHPDLFWAIRGGGGNFGVVTSFTYRLYPVGPTVHVGLLFWETERGEEAVRTCREAMAALPDHSGALMAFGMNAPPAPFVPEKYHFTLGNALIVAGFSSPERHAASMTTIRDALPPLFEFAAPMPYTRLQKMIDDSAPWGVLAYDKSLYLPTLCDDAIAVMSRLVPRKKSPMSFVPTFHLDGAYTEVAEDATAFGGARTPRFAVSITGLTLDPALLDGERAWVRELWEALRPHAEGAGSYVNFMSEFEEDRVRASYGPAKYERLARVKADYDPENLFHLNANIAPAR